MTYQDNTPQSSDRQEWTSTTKLVVVILLIVLAGIALVAARAIIVPLILAWIMAFILSPLVRWIDRRTPIPHGLATGLLYLVLLAGVVVLGISLIPTIVEQVDFLRLQLVNSVDTLLALASNSESITLMGIEVSLQGVLDEIGATLVSLIRGAANDALGIVGAITSTFLLTIFVFLMAFYLTRDSRKLRDWVRHVIPPGYKSDSDIIISELDAIWTAFFRGQITLAIVASFILTAVAAILGLPNPVLFGIFGGLAEFLPTIGSALWLAVAVITALVSGSATLPVSHPVFALIVAIVHIAYTQFDLNYLIPRIVGARINLHPMVVIIGIIVGASIGGMLGVALAAPVIASGRLLLRYVYARLFDIEPFPEGTSGLIEEVEAPEITGRFKRPKSPDKQESTIEQKAVAEQDH